MTNATQLDLELAPDYMDDATCPCCGELAFVDVREIEGREFDIEACCEENRAGWLEEMRSWTRAQFNEWMERQTLTRLRQVITDDDAPSWTLDYGLELAPIDWQAARAFVAEHHRHSKIPRGWKCGASIRTVDTGEVIAVGMLGRPGNRILQSRGWLEITRVCVADIAPHRLTWNACSMLYGWSSREAFKRGAPVVCTYTEAQESGHSLKASSFTRTSFVKGRQWNCKSRPRQLRDRTPDRWRWERVNPRAR